MADKVQLIKEEIERLKEHTAKCGYPRQGEFENGNREGRNYVCNKLLSFINSLPEEHNEDLDFLVISLEETIGTSPHSREVIKEHLQKAAEWQKQQMMKDAVDGEICGEWRNQEDEPYELYAESYEIDNSKFKIGDKVKIIILKED